MASSKIVKNGFKDRKLLIILAIFTAGAIFILTASFLQKLFEDETYYVLNQDVGARTQITPEMLEAKVVPKDSSPAAAIGMEEVQTGNVFTQYPLLAGEVLMLSNVGNLQDISVGVPDSWVITNFSVSADNAVGGRITRGTYFDMMIATPEGSYYPFVNVLALDNTVDLSGASSAEAVDTEEAQSGQTTQYFVGMSPENAAKLQSVMQRDGGNVRLVLSPRQNEYQKPAISEYEGLFNYDPANDGAIWPGVSENGELTDYTFTDVERDELGKPVEKVETCSEGNAKVTGDACN